MSIVRRSNSFRLAALENAYRGKMHTLLCDDHTQEMQEFQFDTNDRASFNSDISLLKNKDLSERMQLLDGNGFPTTFGAERFLRRFNALLLWAGLKDYLVPGSEDPDMLRWQVEAFLAKEFDAMIDRAQLMLLNAATRDVFRLMVQHEGAPDVLMSAVARRLEQPDAGEVNLRASWKGTTLLVLADRSAGLNFAQKMARTVNAAAKSSRRDGDIDLSWARL